MSNEYMLSIYTLEKIMSKALSLKIRDEIFDEVEEIIKKLDTQRNAYINRALEYFNLMNRREFLKDSYIRESKMVSNNSLEILEEFEQFEENITE